MVFVPCLVPFMGVRIGPQSLTKKERMHAVQLPNFDSKIDPNSVEYRKGQDEIQQSLV